jgi:DNA polymerase-3 subunit gamma/tau
MDAEPDKERPDKDYIVIARKWRPSTFDEVVGQDHVTRTLKNALTSGHVAHAYLFTGPRGVGKTTVARLLAKSLNCAEAETLEPCGKCAACIEIAQGTSMDVIEIDGASNRGIDEIRNLRDSVRYAPVGGKKKVYIIDEVHMLTSEAFNALLKTLEEPPPHVVFVFATTQPLKVPQTIVSRCQRFDFRRISSAEIAARLAKICKGDGHKCEPGALALISQQAEGSMRDAQSMLEQVLAFSGGTATEADIRPIMGLRGSELLSRIGRALVGGDEKAVLELLGEASDAGVDPLDLTTSLVEWIRNILITSIDPESRELAALSTEARRELAEEARSISTEHILSILAMLTETEDRIKRATHQRYLLESVLLRATRVKSVAKVSDLIKMLETMGGGTGAGGMGVGGKGAGGGSAGSGGAGSGGGAPSGPMGRSDGPGGHGRTGSKPGAGPASKADGVRTDGIRTDGIRSDASRTDSGTRTDGAAPGGRVICTGLGPNAVGLWLDVVESLRETRVSLASILDLCEPPAYSDGALWLMLPSTFHQSQVLRGDNFRILTQKIEKLTNTSVVLRTRVVDADRAADADGVSAKGARPTGATPSGATPNQARADEVKSSQDASFDAIADRHPIVKALVRNLGGKIVDVRRGRQRTPGGERSSQGGETS